MSVVAAKKIKQKGLAIIEKQSYAQRLKISLNDVKEGRVHAFKNATELLKIITGAYPPPTEFYAIELEGVH